MIDALLANAVLLFSAALVLWLVSLGLGQVSFVDSVWGFAMAGLALASLIGHLRLTKPSDAAFLIALMTIFWGVRLGLHLLRRFLRDGEDARYEAILASDKEQGSWALAVLLRVWLLQSVLLFMVSSPAQVGILSASSEQPVPAWAMPGLTLYLVGMFFEVIGDWQLARFKADPANKGKVMDRGLWRYTRHPNYFGDACVWWGIWLVAMSVAPEAVIWTLLGPIFLTFTLVKWSGAAMTERSMREKYGEEFARYVQRTSAFVPLPPRKG